MNAPLVACLDEKLHIGIHEWNSHCHCRAVWQNKIRVLAELLDDAENIVPPPTVQSGAMVAELEYDLMIISTGL